jgi:hypothetical protein
MSGSTIFCWQILDDRRADLIGMAGSSIAKAINAGFDLL